MTSLWFCDFSRSLRTVYPLRTRKGLSLSEKWNIKDVLSTTCPLFARIFSILRHVYAYHLPEFVRHVEIIAFTIGLIIISIFQRSLAHATTDNGKHVLHILSLLYLFTIYYSDTTWASRRLKSATTRLFVQNIVQTKWKQQSPAWLSLWLRKKENHWYETFIIIYSAHMSYPSCHFPLLTVCRVRAPMHLRLVGMINGRKHKPNSNLKQKLVCP